LRTTARGSGPGHPARRTGSATLDHEPATPGNDGEHTPEPGRTETITQQQRRLPSGRAEVPGGVPGKCPLPGPGPSRSNQKSRPVHAEPCHPASANRPGPAGLRPARCSPVCPELSEGAPVELEHLSGALQMRRTASSASHSPDACRRHQAGGRQREPVGRALRRPSQRWNGGTWASSDLAQPLRRIAAGRRAATRFTLRESAVPQPPLARYNVPGQRGDYSHRIIR
jgi:hypothetical protein